SANHQFVDTAGALAATHHEYHWPLWFESKFLPATRRVAGSELRPHGSAAKADGTALQTACRGTEADEPVVHNPREPAVGTAGNRVGLMQERPRTRGFGSQDRRRAGESTHR